MATKAQQIDQAAEHLKVASENLHTIWVGPGTGDVTAQLQASLEQVDTALRILIPVDQQ